MINCPQYHYKNIHLYNCDCMDYMKDVPDKYFDLAIVDPPYGISEPAFRRNDVIVKKASKTKKYHTAVYKQKTPPNFGRGQGCLKIL